MNTVHAAATSVSTRGRGDGATTLGFVCAISRCQRDRAISLALVGDACMYVTPLGLVPDEVRVPSFSTT